MADGEQGQVMHVLHVRNICVTASFQGEYRGRSETKGIFGFGVKAKETVLQWNSIALVTGGIQTEAEYPP